MKEIYEGEGKGEQILDEYLKILKHVKDDTFMIYSFIEAFLDYFKERRGSISSEQKEELIRATNKLPKENVVRNNYIDKINSLYVD